MFGMPAGCRLLAYFRDWLAVQSPSVSSVTNSLQKVCAMKHVLLLALGFVLTASLSAKAADAPDPTGTWKWTTMFNNQTRENTLKLKLEGDKLTGAILGRDNQETKIEDAKYKDGEVTFTVTRERNGQKFTMKYAGKVEGDTIKGKTSFDRDGNTQSRDWEAKRKEVTPAAMGRPESEETQGKHSLGFFFHHSPLATHFACWTTSSTRCSRMRRGCLPRWILARQAFDEGEVPIGAVIVHDERIIGTGYNQREQLERPHGPRRDDRDHAGCGIAGFVAVARLHAVLHAGALPDVCRGDCAGPHSHGRCMARPIPRPGPVTPSIKSRAIPTESSRRPSSAA